MKIDKACIRMAYNAAKNKYFEANSALNSADACGDKLNEMATACEEAEAMFRVIELAKLLQENGQLHRYGVE